MGYIFARYILKKIEDGSASQDLGHGTVPYFKRTPPSSL
jgi:hypothetical protein